MKNAKDHREIIAELPAAERAAIEGLTRELMGQEMALQQLRKARKLTQEQLAETLKMGQDGISRLESRSDLLISTLQRYVEAMGGELRIVAKFKNDVVTISGFGSCEPAGQVASFKKSNHKKPARRKGHLELAHVR